MEKGLVKTYCFTATMVLILDTLAGHSDWLIGWVRIGTVEVGVMN
jgi:hypothetical protein